MHPSLVQWLIIAMAYVAGIVCGWRYYRYAMAQQVGERFPGNTAIAGIINAGLVAVLVLVLTPRAVPIAGAAGPVQYWVGTPGMLMFFVRTLVFLFLFLVASPFVIFWAVYAVVLTVRREFMMSKMLLVPVVLYGITLAVLTVLNPGFAPMV